MSCEYAGHDKSAHQLHYLKYSDFFWDNFCNHQLKHVSRFRKSDYMRMFAETGLHIIHSRDSVDEEFLAEQNSWKLAARYKGYSQLDLATIGSDLILQKLETASRSDEVINDTLIPLGNSHVNTRVG